MLVGICCKVLGWLPSLFQSRSNKEHEDGSNPYQTRSPEDGQEALVNSWKLCLVVKKAL